MLQGYSWARCVSDVVSPPVVWALLIIPVALRHSETHVQAALFAMVFDLFTCLLPVLFIAYMVKIGKIGDLHMQHRHERYKPLLVTLGCALLNVVALHLLNAPQTVWILAVLSLVQIGAIALITLMWQISMHMMSIAGAAVASGLIFGDEFGLAFAPLIMLVAAARLKLKRHTVAQVIAGTLLGSVVPLALLAVLPFPAMG